ncbi:hypothetical protein [Prosthecomicrobium hirschii]|nr:hypothetical protein [Prosthecomicrobium hirschii]MCW1842525.1 hypothetical protein [Prosthecomicrobium hirschii]
MKIQTNVRAGKQTRGSNDAGNDSSGSTPVYVPPVTRCVGI